MWILHLLPDTLLAFIVNVTLIFGILLTILSFFVLHRILRMIPGLSKYATVIQIISIVILAAGLYFKGGYTTEMIWREEVAKVQAELEQAKNKAAEVIVEVQEKVVYKDRIIKEKGKTLIQYVDREVIKKEEVVKYVENCPVPNDLIDIHNQAAILNSAAQGDKK
jgi:hypothetical protein